MPQALLAMQPRKLLLDWNPRPNQPPDEPKHIRIETLNTLSFYASMEETKMRQSANAINNTYTLKVRTRDFNIMDLGKLPPLTLLHITVDVIDERDRVKPDEEKDQYYT